MTTQVKSAPSVLIPLLLFLLPLFFLPFTLNFFATNKQALVITISLILILVSSLQILRTKNIAIPTGKLILPLGIFAVAITLNLVLIKEGSLESLVNRGSLFFALIVVALSALTTFAPQKIASRTLSGAILGSTLLALHGILQLTFLHAQTYLPTWMQNQSFTPAGSPLILLSFLIPTLVATVILAFKKPDGKSKTIYLLAGGIQLAAGLAYLSLMVTSTPFKPQLLPLGAGWSLALDALKTARSFFLGVGISNFPSLFTAARPLSINASEIWPLVQQASSNEFFQTLATTGALGLASLLYLMVSALKVGKNLSVTPENMALKGLLLTTVLTFALIPGNILTYTLFFVFLAVMGRQSEDSAPQNYHLATNLRLAIVALFATFAIVALYTSSRVYRAELLMRRAQQALSENQAQTLYDSITGALALVPEMTSYHTSFSQVNLTLASSLSQKDTLSDQDRAQITTLVQRAIEEGRIAARLRPNYFSTWQNLGQIYRNLINVAGGAEKFAIDYYAQAVNLNPASPTLRVDYGGLFYQLAQAAEGQDAKTAHLTRAASQFQTAIQLRPSYANAHYNLGKTLELAGNLPGAISSIETALSHLSPDSPDYSVATTELATLKSELAKTQVPAPEPEVSGEDLSTPDPLPSPLPGGEIILDSNL